MANKPNSPKKWAASLAAAKKRFKVYPSAYANGWAVRDYNSKGGTWSSGTKRKKTRRSR